MSAFYFDIRKDTLYCDEKESSKRKASIALLNILLDVLLKWFAPIISFTTEEIFQILKKDKNDSIHLKGFPVLPETWHNDKLFSRYSQLKSIRNVCNAAIEVKRTDKEIGSSLETDLEVYLNENYFKLIDDLDLPEFCITSNAKTKNFDEAKNKNIFNLEQVSGIGVLVKKADGKKCERCWKIKKEVSESTKNKCARCSKIK